MLHGHQAATIIAMMRVSSNECSGSPRAAFSYRIEDTRPTSPATPAPRIAPTAASATAALISSARALQALPVTKQPEFGCAPPTLPSTSPTIAPMIAPRRVPDLRATTPSPIADCTDMGDWWLTVGGYQFAAGRPWRCASGHPGAAGQVQIAPSPFESGILFLLTPGCRDA